MHFRLVATIVVVAALVGAGTPARQAAPVQRPVFRGSTTLVQLDVVVTDASGKPVPGLTKEDFKVLEAGRPRPVVAMNEYHHEAPPPGSLRQDVADSNIDRLVVIVLDDHRKEGPALDRAKTVATQLVTALAGRAHLALVRTSREPGVEFTANAQALLEALALAPTIEKPIVPGPRVWGSIYGRFGADNDDPGGAQQIDPSRSPGRADGPKGVAPIPDTLYNAFADGLLSANDGRRKSFVVISEGGLYTRLAEDPVRIENEVKKLDQRRLTDKNLIDDLHERLQKVFQAAARSNSAVSVIDPRVMMSGRQVSDVGFARLVRATLDALARVSGGTASIRSESLNSSIAAVLSELDDYYVLGFEPVDPGTDKQRTIEVRVGRPDLVVKSRTAFQLDEKARNAALAATRKDPLVGLAYSPIPTANLPLRLWATVLPPSSSGAPASLSPWLDTGGAPLREYAVFVVDMVNRKEVGLPVGRTLIGTPPALMKLEAPVLQPGRYQLRVGAQSDTAGGSVYQTVVVPDFAKTPLVVTGLVLGTETLRRSDAAPLPFTPTLERTFAAESRLRVGFLVWQAGRPSDVNTAIEILELNGRIVNRVERIVAAAAPRVVSDDVRLPSTPGPYVIRISAIGAGQTSSSEIAIRIK